jgi:hypothetical protein
MGLLSGLLGIESETDVEKVQESLSDILGDSESVELAYKLIRDLFIFTNKRLIIINKQGITGKKTEYHSIPYRSIVHFKVESAGHFDIDSELKIWVSSSDEPIVREFKSSTNLIAIQKALANFVL